MDQWADAGVSFRGVVSKLSQGRMDLSNVLRTDADGSTDHVIKFRCSGCKTRISVPETHAGKDGKCRKCGTRLTVPEPEVEISDRPSGDTDGAQWESVIDDDERGSAAEDEWEPIVQEDDHSASSSERDTTTRSAVVDREGARPHLESVEVYRVDYWTWARHAAFASFILTCLVGGGLLLSLESVQTWQPSGQQLVTDILPWLVSVVLLCPVMFTTSMVAVWSFNLIASWSRGLRIAVITRRELSVGPYEISAVGIIPTSLVGGTVGGLLAAVTFAMVGMMAQVPSGFLSTFREAFRANMEALGIIVLSATLGGALLGLLVAVLYNAAAKLFGGVLVRMAAVGSPSTQPTSRSSQKTGTRPPDLQSEPVESWGRNLPSGQIEIEGIDSLLTGWLLALYNGLATLGLTLALAASVQLLTQAQYSLPLNVVVVSVVWNMFSGFASGVVLSIIYNLAALQVGGIRLRINPLT